MGDSDILIRQELMKQGEITKIMKYFTIAMDSKKKKQTLVHIELELTHSV
jgi:hypothetical protein